MAIINAGPAERRNDLNLYLTAFFFALLRMVILSAKCHANQCETFRRATSSGTFDAQQPDTSRSGEMHTVQWQAPATAVTRTATQARQSNSVDLDKARLVVSVGRGIGSKENISLAEALCQTIGAELACSRPVAENEKWMEHERYVGISNLMLKPELYLAVGISGQIQHMVGANGAQTIFAINKDKNAPIFQYADFGIVGDALKILPALTAALAR